MKRIQIILTAVIAAVFLRTGEGNAQSLTLTIPDTTGLKGQEMLVPVYFGTAETEDQIFSIQTGFSAGSQIFSILGIQTAGTMSAGLSAVFNQHNLQLAIASSEPITGNGILVYLKVLPSGSPNSSTSFNLINPRLNEGSPAVVSDNGTFRLRYLSINPTNPPNNLVIGDSLQFSAGGDVVQPLSWAVSDTSLLSISATGKIKVKKQGIATVSVTDGEGKSAESNRFTLSPPALKSLTVSVPDTAIRQTLYFDLPVRVTNVSGLGITSYELTVGFPSTILTFHGVVTEGTMTASWLPPGISVGSNSVELASASSNPLEGAGTLLKLRFRMKETATGSGTVTFNSVLFNETIQSAVDNGTISAQAAPIINSSPASANLIIGETVQASVLNGGKGPFLWESSDPEIASVNEETGVILGVARGKTQVFAIDSEGFRSKPVQVNVSDFQVFLTQTEALAGEPFLIEINLPESVEGNLVSTGFTMKWDTSLVRLLGLKTTGYQMESWVSEFTFRNDTLVVAAAGVTPLASGATLAALEVISNSAGSWPIEFTSIRFNEPGPETPLARSLGMTVEVGTANQPPVWEITLPDTTISENQLLSFSVVATDPDSPVRYRLHSGPAGAVIDSLTGQFNWLPDFNESGVYEVILTANDETFSVADTASITVNNVNRAPGSFSLLNPQSGDTVVILRPGPVVFHWQRALDPDGDNVTYSLRVYKENFEFNLDAISDDSVVVNNLKSQLIIGETYSWYVTAHDPLDSTAVSNEIFSFFVLETGVSVNELGLPETFYVSPAYPNPFNPSTKFTIRLPVSETVTISVYDVTGREAMKLPGYRYPAGVHTIPVSAGALASGTYFVRVTAGTFTEILKISLQK